MSYWRLYYHAVWSTESREPLLNPNMLKRACGSILDTAKRSGIIVHAVGGFHDHIHVAFSAPPTTRLSEIIGHFKGQSSYILNHFTDIDYHFAWQNDYSIHSFSPQTLPTIITYIQNQQQHHNNGTIEQDWERTQQS